MRENLKKIKRFVNTLDKPFFKLAKPVEVAKSTKFKSWFDTDNGHTTTVRLCKPAKIVKLSQVFAYFNKKQSVECMNSDDGVWHFYDMEDNDIMYFKELPDDILKAIADQLPV